MTRSELLAEASRLEALLSQSKDCELAMHELEVFREEIRQQHEELVRAREALESSRDRYADLYDFAPVAYVTLSGAGVIEEMNLTAAELLRMDRARTEGRPFLTHVAPAARRTFLEHMRRCRESAEPVRTELALLIGGRSVPVELYTKPYSAPGSDICYRTAISDLTARIHAEEERRRSRREREVLLARQEAAEAASEAKDRFIGILSHELRTPLTPILMLTSALERRRDLAPDLRSMLAIIRRNIELEARLIDDLLDVSRIMHRGLALHPETVDAHAVLREVLSTFAGEIESGGMTVHTEPAAAEHHTYADPARIRQVFSALVQNAIRFTARGGGIHIATSNPQPQELMISITDTGIGIEPPMLQRVFTPFERLEQAGGGYSGLGLGLAISKGVVEAHGGRIAAYSAGKGQGTRVDVIWPTAPAAATHTSVPQAQAPAVAGTAGQCVLLVENDPDSAKTLALLLREEGLKVTIAPSAHAAAGLNPCDYDLVITDVGLPDGNGLDLVRRIRQSCAVPCIALSGFGSDEDEERSKAAGCAMHLTKPIDFEGLLAAIGSIAARAQDTGAPAGRR
jgi:PAS domain S-box-containing protein